MSAPYDLRAQDGIRFQVWIPPAAKIIGKPIIRALIPDPDGMIISEMRRAAVILEPDNPENVNKRMQLADTLGVMVMPMMRIAPASLMAAIELVRDEQTEPMTIALSDVAIFEGDSTPVARA